MSGFISAVTFGYFGAKPQEVQATTSQAKPVSITVIAQKVLADLQYVDFLLNGEPGIKDTRKKVSEAVEAANLFSRKLRGDIPNASSDIVPLNIKHLVENPNTDGSYTHTFFSSVPTLITELNERCDKKHRVFSAKEELVKKLTTANIAFLKHRELQAHLSFDYLHRTAMPKDNPNPVIHPEAAKVAKAVTNHSLLLDRVQLIETKLHKYYISNNAEDLTGCDTDLQNIRLEWKKEHLSSPELTARIEAAKILVSLAEMKKLQNRLINEVNTTYEAIFADIHQSLKDLTKFDFWSKTPKDEVNNYVAALTKFKECQDRLLVAGEKYGQLKGALDENETKAVELLKVLHNLAENDQLKEEIQRGYLELEAVIESERQKIKDISRRLNESNVFYKGYCAELIKLADFKQSCIETGSLLRNTRMNVSAREEHFKVLESSKEISKTANEFPLTGNFEALTNVGIDLQKRIYTQSLKEEVEKFQANGAKFAESVKLSKEWFDLQVARVGDACAKYPLDQTFDGDFRAKYSAESVHHIKNGDVSALLHKAWNALFSTTAT